MQNSNSKYYLAIIGALLAVIVILIILVMSNQKNNSQEIAPVYDTNREYQTIEKNNENDHVPPPQQTTFNWSTLSSAQISAVLAANPGIYFEGMPTFSESIDLTGDGVVEGVFTGNGGNSGLAMILIRNSDGTITAARYKTREGVINPVSLLSVGRVMVQEKYELLPIHHGFYTASLSNDGESGNFVCNINGVNAYAWNSTTKLFEWNQSLTTTYTAQVCN